MIDTVHANLENETKNANVVLGVVSKGLLDEGFITPEQQEEILSKYIIVVNKPNWFLEIIRKFWRTENWSYTMVKVIGAKVNEIKEEKRDSNEEK